ncbi:hypothetical protein MTO96_012461 [Rhipicephalus appendiculatus]
MQKPFFFNCSRIRFALATAFPSRRWFQTGIKQQLRVATLLIALNSNDILPERISFMYQKCWEYFTVSQCSNNIKRCSQCKNIVWRDIKGKKKKKNSHELHDCTQLLEVSQFGIAAVQRMISLQSA